jgi:photosystem II stability/assembly factor-like uncharacterized protein
VGAEGQIYRSADLGRTWVPITLDLLDPPNAFISKIHFPTRDIGYAVAGRTVLKTSDGGESWQNQAIGPGTSYFTGCFFTSVSDGYLVSPYYSFVMKTTDGAKSLNLVSDFSAQAVFFPTPSIGYLVGGTSRIISTRDAGVTWMDEETGLSQDYLLLSDVWFWDSSHGIVVGDSGTVLLFSDSPGAAKQRKRRPVANLRLKSPKKFNLKGVQITKPGRPYAPPIERR